MKITFILPHLKPAGGILAPMVFAHELSTRGHLVTIAVESKVWTRYVRNLVNRHPLLPTNSSVRIIRVKDFSALPDADVFIASSWQLAKRLLTLKIEARKYYYIQHDERLYHGESEAVETIYRSPLIRIANASWLKQMFKTEFNEEIPLLLNAVDCDQFNPIKRTRLPNDGEIKILLLHHDYEWKGTKEGVVVITTLQQKYPNVRLVLFGTRAEKISYPHDEYYYKLYGDDLARLFANSDIFLGSSWDEGLNFPPRWAMASGCAVVTYSNGSSDDYAFDGDTALVAERKNTKDLSQKLESLIQDALLRKQISDRGVDYIRTMPTWKELTDILEEVLTRNEHD